MAPAKKSPVVKKTSGKDIRTFFGGGGNSSQTLSGPSQQNTQSQKQESSPTKPKPIEISDDDSEPAKPATPKPKSERVMVIDSDEDEAPRRPSRISQLKRKKAAIQSSSDEDQEPVMKVGPPKKKTAVTTKASSKPSPSTPVSNGKKKTAASNRNSSRTTRKKVVMDEDFAMTSSESEDDDPYVEGDEDEVAVVAKKGKSKAKEKNATSEKTRTRTRTKPENTKKERYVEPAKSEAEPEKDVSAPTKSFNWAAAKAAKLAGPVAHGSKEVPEPKSMDCLAGLSFVFTGELSSFSRDEAVDLAKRFGGRVTGQPSSKTSFVILGDNAGPSKMNAIKKHGLKSLSEDEFLSLIATREGPGGPNGAGYDEKTKKKMEKEQDVIRKAAKELENREKQAMKNDWKHSGGSKPVDVSSQLWTTKYAPQSLKEICGNKGQVEKLQLWLHDWSNNLKSGFKKPGKNGMNIFRAVMVTGSPGIGKTTSAHLCAKLEGFTPIELNASDARSKKLVESGMNINNTSLDGWMGGNSSINAVGVAITDKTCLIMDEVDGMSAGDRGGVGALNALIKKSKIPIICIANDRNAQKLKPLLATTFNLPFRKPEATAVRSRMLTIAFKEKMKLPANVIDQLITGAQSDIRQVLNMLSTWKLSSDTMTFDEGKEMAKTNEKYTILTPFDVTYKMLGPYMFSSTSRETLGDKMELYFHDHSFVPLFIQENYLKTQPARLRSLEGPPKVLKQLELMDKAASSISDADLVDALIHGPEQHWSLMPLHAVCSTVRPASFLYGAGGGYGGPNAMSFPQWLGQNSKQNKLNRQLGDVQIRMRLKVSGDKAEIRQSYLPALFPHIVKPLVDEGTSAVDEVIERMDEYYLSKEDWDTVVELGVDQNKDDAVLKKISAATKTSFTKKYNAGEHPIPFHKAQDLGKVPKKLAGGPAPDLEEAFDLADDVPEEASDDEKKVKDVDDFKGDKLIKEAKAKKKGKANTKAR